MGGRLKALVTEYGHVAIVIYLVISVLVFGGFAIAIMQGFEVESAAGILGAAWVATKLTQPVRIGVALVLTPIVGRLMKRHQTSA